MYVFFISIYIYIQYIACNLSHVEDALCLSLTNWLQSRKVKRLSNNILTFTRIPCFDSVMSRPPMLPPSKPFFERVTVVQHCVSHHTNCKSATVCQEKHSTKQCWSLENVAILHILRSFESQSNHIMIFEAQKFLLLKFFFKPSLWNVFLCAPTFVYESTWSCSLSFDSLWKSWHKTIIPY